MAMVTTMPHYSEYHLLSDLEIPGIMGVSSRNVIDNRGHHHLEKRSPTLITKTLFKKLLLLKVLKKLKLG